MLAGNEIGDEGDEKSGGMRLWNCSVRGDWLGRLSRAVEVRKGEKIFGV
jgi:hypothetical protein